MSEPLFQDQSYINYKEKILAEVIEKNKEIGFEMKGDDKIHEHKEIERGTWDLTLVG